MRTTEEQLEIGSDTWWIGAAVLTGILTMAFGMFAVIVAIPKVMTVFGTDVNTIQWVMTGVASLGPTVGQLLGGYLVEMISWRAIFFLSLPSGFASLLLTLVVVPRDVPSAGSTLDLPGLMSMTVFLVALLLALSQGHHEGWDSSYILSLWAIATVFFSIFLVTQLTVPHPVVHLRLYRHFEFSMASIVVFLYNAGFMGANFLIALMLQALFDFTPIQAGYILAPGAAVMGLSGFLSGKFSDRLDPRWLLQGGVVGQSMQTQALSALQHLMSDHVRVAAYTDCFAILALFFLGAVIPAWFIRAQASPPRRAVPATPAHTSERRETASLAKVR
jgi:MFS family permease